MTNDFLTREGRPSCLACDILELPREEKYSDGRPAALLCRLFGHKMIRQARGTDTEGLEGQFEISLICRRGCRSVQFWVRPDKDLGARFHEFLYPKARGIRKMGNTIPPTFSPYVPLVHTHEVPK